MKIFLILLILVTACSTEPTAENDTSIDAGSDAPDDVEKKVVIKIENTIENSWKFTMREPRTEALDCAGVKYPDLDWLCTFDFDGAQSVLYFQNSPKECTESELPVQPSYRSTFSRKMGGSITNYSDVTYSHQTEQRDEIQGEIQNDSLRIAYGLKTIKYYHSSFGADLGQCQPMDCIQVYDNEGMLETDGCTPERSLPIVCIPVKAAGKYDDASLADTFMKCAGDTL